MIEKWSWCPIIGLERKYIVSNIGRVISVPRIVVDKLGRERIYQSCELKIYTSKHHVQLKDGYKKVDYCTVKLKSAEAKKDLRISVAKLVMLAFGAPDAGLSMVYHLNGVADDNCIDNLTIDKELGSSIGFSKTNHKKIDPSFDESTQEPITKMVVADRIHTYKKPKEFNAMDFISSLD